jgi:hypothetical protein
MKRLIPILALFLMTLFSGCRSQEQDPDTLDGRIATKQAQARLAVDMRRLQSFSRELADQEKEMEYLQQSVGLKERLHYTSDEHDQIENLLFRYLACRESLWEIINYYRDYRDNFSDKSDQVKGFMLGFDAALHLAYYSSLLVATFIDHDVVIGKLNEEYYRSDIPRGTYDRLLDSLTNIEHIEILRTAWELYSTEMENDKSLLYTIVQTEPDYRLAASQIASLYRDTDARIEYILEKKSLLLPDVRNRLRHSMIAVLAQKAKQELGDNLYAVRGILFLNVSRIKSPISVNIRFGEKQIERMKKLLEPGDVILTYSAGYMSNVFLPGKFKHGITYVGLPRDRRQVGLAEGTYPELPEEKIAKLKADLKTAKLESGLDADLIEAVAEGVIFNSLEEIAKEHMARLCVLRPRLRRNQLVDALTNIFLLLGNSYDFKFDFTDGSRQCCTEVIYRSLHNQKPIRFNLIKRMGIWTLSADDLVHTYLSSKPGVFDFVLYAEENPDSKGEAVIWTGSAGERRLAALMNGN